MLDFLKAALQFLKDFAEQRKSLETFLGHPVPAWLISIVHWVALLFLGLSVCLAFLYLLRSLREQWVDLWRSIVLNEEEKHRCRRRQRFAAFIQSQLVKLSLAESWEDFRFAELEAEIEAEGRKRWATMFPRLGLFEGGLRREQSLSKALESSREQIILLEGDPGAGKSVALRHVADQVARRAAGSWNDRSTIPIYVNLKQLRPPTGVPIDQDLIRTFVLDGLQKVNSRDVVHFLEEEFPRGLEEGTWLFLFDSFDEIPDVLGSTDDDQTIARYTDAIYEFLTTFNACRGVIASRQFRRPRRMGLPRFRILPLSDSRRIELVRRSGLKPRAQEELLSHLTSFADQVSQMATNPMFLGLLCEFMHDGGGLPSSPHATFERYVEKRLTRDEPKTIARFGVGSGQIRVVAETVAFAMAADGGLGLEPTRSAIASAIQHVRLELSPLFDASLDALEFIKLARPDAEALAGTERRFTFAHRRFQEYFATSVVIRAPDRVASRQLLTEPRWRETAVVMCQTQPRESLHSLLETAIETLNVMVGVLRTNTTLVDRLDDGARVFARRARSFLWPSGCQHLLGILQDGLFARLAESPSGLRIAARSLVITAWCSGRLLDRVQSVEVAATLPEPELLALLRECMSSYSQLLQDAAYAQVQRLHNLPPDFVDWIRNSLVMLALRGQIRRQKHAIFAYLGRLEQSSELKYCASLLLRIPECDVVIATILGCLYLLALNSPVPPQVGISLAMLYVCVTILRPSTVATLEARLVAAVFEGGPAISIKGSKARASGVGTAVRACLVSFGIRTGACLAVANFGPPLSPHMLRLLIVASIYICTWAPMAMFVAGVGECVSPVWWPLLPLSPVVMLGRLLYAEFKRPLPNLREILREIREILREMKENWWAGLVVLYVAASLILVARSIQPAEGPYPESITGIEEKGITVLIALEAAVIALVVNCSVIGGLLRTPLGWFKDVLRFRQYVKKPPRDLSPERLLEELGAWHHDSFRPRFVALIRRENLLPPTRESEEAVVSLALVLEQRADYGVASEAVATWYKQYRVENAWRFHRWATEALDELCLLERQLQEQRNSAAVAQQSG